MDTTLEIALDWWLIGRSLAALLWGILYAIFLSYTDGGRFLANRRTWLSVVIGLGVDLIIGFNADYTTLVIIIALSSLGLIYRSLQEERQGSFNPNSYRMKHRMEDALDDLTEAQDRMEMGLETQEWAEVSRALSRTHSAHENVRKARYGE